MAERLSEAKARRVYLVLRDRILSSAIASMKCNIDFLQAVLGGSASTLALDALADLATAVTRLETRQASTRMRPAYTLLPPRGHR